MKNEYKVELFYGVYDIDNNYGVTFFFNTFNQAEVFIKDYVKNNSNCNARLIVDYKFGD